MKRILTVLAFVCLSVSSFAQTIWKDTVTFPGSFPKDGFVHELYDTIYNSSSSPLTLTWTKQSESLLTGWSGVGICDQPIGGGIGTCYLFNDLTTHSVIIPANGKATIDVQMKAVSTAADGCSYVTVSSSAGPLTFKFCAWPSAVKDFDNSNMVNIYPNPASDYVNISIYDKRITNVNVVSVIGRRIARFNVDANRTEDIRVPLDKVADGIYLLQFADVNGKVLGVRRVTKQ